VYKKAFFDIIAFEKYCDLETQVRGHSRSLATMPSDRAHSHMTIFTFYTKGHKTLHPSYC